VPNVFLRTRLTLEMLRLTLLFIAAVLLAGCASLPTVFQQTVSELPAQCLSDGSRESKNPLVDNYRNPIRGVWIPGPNHTTFWDGPQAMERQFAQLASRGINAAFVVMWNQGRTFYPSKVMRDLIDVEIDERVAGRDPLAEMITAAKPHGIKIFAWFEYGFAIDRFGAKGIEIAKAKPEWVALKSDGQPLIKNGLRWLNAFDPDVQQFVASLMLEVAQRYDVAGVQGDDRLPALPFEGGYNPMTLARYAAQTGEVPPRDRGASNGNHPSGAKRFSPEWERWHQWRADQLTQFMSRLYRDLKAAKPDLIVSMAPTYYPWAIEDWLQDWPAWMRLGIIDHLAPQLYQKTLPAYEKAITELATKQVPKQKLHLVSPGVLTKLSDGYQATPELIAQMRAVNRSLCINSEVLFFHESEVGKR
jgi:uncharacterized lipoprotein YddW (UPF0748 family)